MIDDIHTLFKRYREHEANFIWMLLKRLSTATITFIILFIAARLLYPNEFGQFSYLIALVSFLVIFGEFGLSSSVSKHVAEYNIRQKEKTNPIILSSLTISFVLSLAVSIIFLFFMKYSYAKYFDYSIYLVPLVFLISLVNILEGAYRGLKKFKKLAIFSIMSGLIVIPSTFFLINNYGIIGAITVQIFYYLLFFLLLMKHIGVNGSFDLKMAKTVFGYAIIIGFASLAYFLYTRVDILILEYFGYVVEIGYYEILNRIFNFLFLPFALLGQVIAPYVTELMTNKKYNKIIKYTVNLRYFLLVGIGVSLITYFILPIIIKIILPRYFSDAFLIILTVLLVLLPFKIMGVILTQGFVIPTGFAKIASVLTLGGGVINIIFDIIFINWLGFIGVFYATLLVHSFVIILTYVFYYKNIKDLMECDFC
ncbi:MAG: oligosaccharide flippase family protein [Atribacterota bacterium]